MRRRLVLAVSMLAAGASPATAGAVSVAYLDGGDVYVASLDGTQRHRLTTDGSWRNVAASDTGRVAAVRRLDGENPRLSRLAAWEPDGRRSLDGFLPSPNGWQIYAYPVTFDISGDGDAVTYGYSMSRYILVGSDYQYQAKFGHWVITARTPTTLDTDLLTPAGTEYPTFAGSRIVAASGGQVAVMAAARAPYDPDFTPWLTPYPAPGYGLARTDVAANGRLAALEMERWEDTELTATFVDLTRVDGLGGTPDASCILPAQGMARHVSVSQDAARIAWKDDGGVWVAGAPDFTKTGPVHAPSGAAHCVLSAPKVLITATGSSPSIGGGDVARMIPPAAGPGGGGGAPAPGGAPGQGGTGAAPVRLTVTAPAKATVAAMRKGITLRVAAPAAGRITVTATVRGSRIGRKGAAGRRPVVVARGTARAPGAGKVAVRVKLTAVGRAKQARLRGARLTVRTTLGRRAVTRTLTVR